MDRPHVLSEKVRRPTHVGLSRARLEAPLLATDGPGLTLVCAPAGSGKSTLLTTAAARATVPVAWYRVTVDDATSAALVAHLAATLDRALDIAAARAAHELSELLAALDRNEQPCLLILDDLHEIVGTEAEQALETFLSLRPRVIRVALGSRRPPEFNLPLLRATGAIHEVTADDLRFRVWEVEELFTVVHGEPLSPETAATLTRRTAGWAAGLQLFHLANARKTGLARQQAVSELSARSRLIRSYLARNVLDQLSDARRRFLVQTCALGLLTGPLCDALLDTTGSAEVLEELERDQLFTASTDDGLTFRYHEVLQRHLELALVLDLGADRARQWYARCASLLNDAGAYTDALRAYSLAEDWRSVAELVQLNAAAATTAIASGPDVLLPARLLRDDPWLAIAEARRRLRRGAVVDAVSAFKHAESLLDEPRFRSSCAAERSAAALWCGESEPHGSGPAIGRSAEWTDRLRALTRKITPERSPADLPAARDDEREMFVRGAHALLGGHFAAASMLFADVVIATADVTMPRLAAQLSGVVSDLADGDCADFAERLEQITVDAESSGFPWFERLARGLHASALAVSSAAPWRLGACSELLVECDRDGDRWGAALLQLASAVAARLVQHPAAHDRFIDAAERFRALDAAVLASWAETLEQRWPARPAGSSAAPADASDAVRLTCFGGFEISIGGRPIELDELRPRALTLLRLLALDHDRPVHRERLIDTLWPDASLDVGTRRLQVAISSIRHVLQNVVQGDEHGDDTVLRSGDSYRLRVPDATVDVQSFEELLAAAAAEPVVERRVATRRQALRMYTGDLFPEEGSADHVVGERDRLRLAAAGAACALAGDLSALGQYNDAVASARRSVELDRYQDIAWELLVEALARSGDDSAATRARLEHRRIRSELEDETLRTAADPVTPTPMSTSRAAVERSLSVR